MNLKTPLSNRFRFINGFQITIETALSLYYFYRKWSYSMEFHSLHFENYLQEKCLQENNGYFQNKQHNLTTLKSV